MLSGIALPQRLSAWTRGSSVRSLRADDAFRSFISRTSQPSVNPKTIADGLLSSTGEITFLPIVEHVDATYTVRRINYV
ncbi:hypothetical protein JB92DRAFT_2997746, partial [Gautieria morchelliformis]